jgi:hypothetical protein
MVSASGRRLSVDRMISSAIGVQSNRHSRLRAIRVAMVLVAMPLISALAPQQQRDPEKDTTAILQASYLYNIAKLTEWKEERMRTGNFVIGIIGGGNLHQELIKKYSTKTVGNQQIQVVKLLGAPTTEKCHMLFVGQSALNLLPEIYKKLGSEPTMIVTEYPDALEDGSVVNFVRVENSLKYELSVPNAKKHKLEVGITLRNLAHRTVQ